MPSDQQTEEGLELLRRPVTPLARIVSFLFLTGPFSKPSEIVSELTEAIEMAGVSYERPAENLHPYLDELAGLAMMKNGQPTPFTIIDQEGQPVNPIESAQLMVLQRILTRELERINSLLCGPCLCDLCCVGPDQSQSQLFFEIPLSDAETERFQLPSTDNDLSRQTTSAAEPPLMVDGGLSFHETGPRLVRWQNGWSMILPRNCRCPQLLDSGGCRIYPDRPEVCRRPQIFPYLLERQESSPPGQQAYTVRGKLLAVWDCPYVRQFKDEIARFAEMCELEPVFMQNKA